MKPHRFHPFALLALVLAVPIAHAADYSLADGVVRFAAPDAWPLIMEKLDGDPQFLAFQVRNPGPEGADTLARITVSTQHVGDAQSFQQFVNDGIAKARKLPGYLADNRQPLASSLRYTAMENSHKTTYLESYAFRSGIAIQVRCIRPRSAPAQWSATFDAGCTAIVSAVAH